MIILLFFREIEIPTKNCQFASICLHSIIKKAGQTTLGWFFTILSDDFYIFFFIIFDILIFFSTSAVVLVYIIGTEYRQWKSRNLSKTPKKIIYALKYKGLNLRIYAKLQFHGKNRYFEFFIKHHIMVLGYTKLSLVMV